MKIKSLKNYGIPSYIVNIWEKDPSPYLLPLQEGAVKNYGILNYEGSIRLPRRDAPRNDRGIKTNNIYLQMGEMCKACGKIPS
jgi:helicase